MLFVNTGATCANIKHWWKALQLFLLYKEVVRIRIRIGTRIRRIRMFWALGSAFGSFHHQAKIIRKTLIYNVLWLLYDFLSLKNDVNVPVLRIRIRIGRIRMFLGLPDAYLDPLIRGTDPRIRILIRIRIKVSRIHNTGTKSLGQSGDLQIHLWVPTGEKSFSWPHCIKSFARSGDLQKHSEFTLVRNRLAARFVQSRIPSQGNCGDIWKFNSWHLSWR